MPSLVGSDPLCSVGSCHLLAMPIAELYVSPACLTIAHLLLDCVVQPHRNAPRLSRLLFMGAIASLSTHSHLYLHRGLGHACPCNYVE